MKKKKKKMYLTQAGLQARIAVYDSEGYPIWFADFNHTAGGKDPSLWLTASSLTDSSDRKLKTAKDASFL